MGDALHTHGGVTDAREARLAQGGLIAVQGPTSLDIRTGVMVALGASTLISGTSATGTMTVAIAPHQWVTTRGAANGPYLGVLEAATAVNIAAAPATGAGTRIDVVYVKQQDSTAGIPSPDGTTAPLYGVVTGVAGGSKPALPVGAEELGTVSVSPGATSTAGANVVIANTARITVARGATVPVRDQAARDAMASYPGLTVYRIDTGNTEQANKANNGWNYVSGPNPPVTNLSINTGWVPRTSFRPKAVWTAPGGTVFLHGRVENLNTFTLGVGVSPLFIPGSVPLPGADTGVLVHYTTNGLGGGIAHGIVNAAGGLVINEAFAGPSTFPAGSFFFLDGISYQSAYTPT